MESARWRGCGYGGSSQFDGRLEFINRRVAAIGVPALHATLDVPHPEQRLLFLAHIWEVHPMPDPGYHASPVCDSDKKLRVCRGLSRRRCSKWSSTWHNTRSPVMAACAIIRSGGGMVTRCR